MTAEQLEELLDCLEHTPSEYWAMPTDEALRLARRVIAAEKMVEALEYIAKQKKTDELETEYDVEVADFEGEYDMCIDRARTALTAYREASK